MLQAERPDVLGPGGAGLAYGDAQRGSVRRGLNNSLALEFDTHRDVALGDPNGNHVSVHSRGAAQQNSADQACALANGTNAAINPLSGVTSNVTVEFWPGRGLLVHIAPLTGAVLDVPAAAPLARWMELDEWGAAYIGFTAATGAESGEEHAVSDWAFEFLGRADAANARTSGDGLQSATAGEFARIDVQLVDQFGNTFTDNDGVELNATLAGAPQSRVHVDYLGLGQYAVQFNATMAGAANVSIAQNGASIAGSPFAPVVEAGAADASKSKVSGNATASATQTAGSELTLHVQTVDRFGNALARGGDAVKAEITKPNGIIEKQALDDHGDGTYSLVLRPTLAGNWTWLVLVNDAEATKRKLAVAAAPLSAPHCMGSLNSEIATDQNTTLLVYLRDQFGNAVPRRLAKPLDVKFGGNANATSCRAEQRGVPHDTSEIEVLANCRRAGQYLIDVTAAPAQATGGEAGPVAGSPFSLQVFPAQVCSVGFFRLRDWSPHTTAQALNASDTRVHSPFLSGFAQPAQLNAAFVLDTYDYDGNHRDSAADVFNATALVDDKAVPSHTKYDGDGRYAMLLNLTKVGDFVLNVLVNGALTVDSPHGLQVKPAAIDAAASHLVSTAPLNGSLTGKTTSVTLQLRDRFDNDALSADVPLYAVLRYAPSDANDATNVSSVMVSVRKDDAKGQAALSFKADRAGRYLLDVKVRTESISGSPFTVIVVWSGLADELLLIIVGGVILALVLALVAALAFRAHKRRRRKTYEKI